MTLLRQSFPRRWSAFTVVGANSAKYHKLSEAECAALRCELGYAEGEKILLCTGELLPNKNQITAIRAMKTLIEHQPKAKLLLAGNGPTLPELQAEVTALELQGYVEFLGYRTDLERYANIADVIVSCSYREGLPMNIVEGMLLGKPVVASYNRGHRELIVPEKTGYMVPPADSDAFAEKIAVLLNDGELAGRMGQAGYEKGTALCGYQCAARAASCLRAVIREDINGRTVDRAGHFLRTCIFKRKVHICME